MHKHAELGVAAHWRYAEGRHEEERRQLRRQDRLAPAAADLEATTSPIPPTGSRTTQAALDETIYVMTPQGWVVDLPRARHRSISASVWVTPTSGIAAPRRQGRWSAGLAQHGAGNRAARRGGRRQGRRSVTRLAQPSLGYLITHRARLEGSRLVFESGAEETLAEGRAVVTKELQRLGQAVSISTISRPSSVHEGGRPVHCRRSQRTRHAAVPGCCARDRDAGRGARAPEPRRQRKAPEIDRGILIVGDKLLTQLARCCKPAPRMRSTVS